MQFLFKSPKDVNPLDHVISFSNHYSKKNKLIAPLKGCADSIRQAEAIRGEPIEKFLYLTAQEEASTFLFQALSDVGYSVPKINQLHDHLDKVKVLVLCNILFKHFIVGWTDEVYLKMEIVDGKPTLISEWEISGDMKVTNHYILQTIVQEASDGVNKPERRAIAETIKELSAGKKSPLQTMKQLANERNLSLYGQPNIKKRIDEDSERTRFTLNCIVQITMGYMILFEGKVIPDVEELVKTFCSDHWFSKDDTATVKS